MSKTILALLALILCAAGARAAGPPLDEFVGPFPSWRNVQRDYGARGDGKTDDTAAFQRALNDLTLHKQFCVLYVPAGTYRLTGTIKTERHAHTEGMGMMLVGEDPARCILHWDGPAGGTLLQWDAWYSTISRLTLDGAGKAGILLAYGPAFSTYNETTDMVFQDAATGVQMGVADAGQAENMVLRCQFRRCSNAGLTTVNFNSMDIWAWYCRFSDCGHALYNSAGNFHAWQCLFERSHVADIGTANLMVFSFVNNTSIGSRRFMDFASGHTWGSPCSVTGNRILEPLESPAIRLGNGGPFLLLDNIIRARLGAKGPLVEMTWGDQALIGNTYSLPEAVKEAGRFRRIVEKVVPASRIKATAPELPGTPPKLRRPVIEVKAGADAGAIQAAINEAARLRDRRPVVHLPMGVYPIDHTLVVPAGSDLQLVGDGAAETATVLRWSGAEGGLVLRLDGPSRATVRDLAIESGRASGLLVAACDQPGGWIYGDQVNVSGQGPEEKTEDGLLVNGVEESDVTLLCHQGGSYSRRWVRVIGGPRRAAGREAPGQAAVYNGATGTADAQYAVERGGRLIVRGVYHEVDADSPQGILLADRGTLSVDATRFSYRTAPDRPLILANGFRGTFTLLTGLLLPVETQAPARVEITGDGRECRVLCLADLFWQNTGTIHADDVWRDRAQPVARAGMALCNVNYASQDTTRKSGFQTLEARGVTDDAFILSMLRPLRAARVPLPTASPAGITNVRLHRVRCTAGRGTVAVEFRR
ncbi:MAG TPA: glycosyl hydrolase family 28-related protein [Chthonomonadaceae bacterium]|nr:glycosyl hydrolase family 28-related protein [Chthonomonadaceae bacterium]